MDMQTLGRMLLVFAAVLAALGALMWLGGRLGLGNLPGDFRFGGQGWSCYVPIVSSIVLSVLLTVLLNLFFRGGK